MKLSRLLSAIEATLSSRIPAFKVGFLGIPLAKVSRVLPDSLGPEGELSLAAAALFRIKKVSVVHVSQKFFSRCQIFFVFVKKVSNASFSF